MSNVKITDLTELTTPAVDDYLVVVDTSTSTTKKIRQDKVLTGAGDGTVSAPGIAFVSDPDTGVYRVGANQLGIATAGVLRQQVDASGVQHFSQYDNAASPVAPTGAIKFFAHNKSVADDASITLPTVTTNGFGVVICDTDASERSQFFVDSTGTVTLINNAGSVVANADTDANLCIGTAATQEPLLIKNRLGATKVVNVILFYD